MSQVICIFEDEQVEQFNPLTYTRPVYELRCGILTLREKITHRVPGDNVFLLTRPYLAGVLSFRTNLPVNNFAGLKKNDVLLVNGRMVADDSFPKLLKKASDGETFVHDGNLILGRIAGDSIQEFVDGDSGLFDSGKFLRKRPGRKAVVFRGKVVNYAWDLVARNPSEISEDFPLVTGKPRIQGDVHLSSVHLGAHRIFVGKGSKIDPLTVLDARNGPIWIGEDATVSSLTRIDGPVCVHRGAMLSGGRIREGTSIGPFCRVGGEVGDSVFQAYSNKYHDGFLGHSYVGEWVNLGAMTTNSDLKNNYANVRAVVNGDEIDTGYSKVGCFIGDHAKTGIGTLINTGTVIGVGCNIFGGKMPAKFVPSFFWGSGEEGSVYDFEKFLDTAGKVMLRRKIKMGKSEAKMLGKVFELTLNERRELKPQKTGKH